MIALLVVFGCHTPPSAPEGLVLAKCWSTPNCVSSQAPADDPHHVGPLALHGSPEDAPVRLAAVMESVDGVSTVVTGPSSVQATFVLPSGLFTDDVHAVIDPEAGVVHVRSSSRLGVGDNGVNRDRVEALRSAWSEAAGG